MKYKYPEPLRKYIAQHSSLPETPSLQAIPPTQFYPSPISRSAVVLPPPSTPIILNNDPLPLRHPPTNPRITLIRNTPTPSPLHLLMHHRRHRWLLHMSTPMHIPIRLKLLPRFLHRRQPHPLPLPLNIHLLSFPPTPMPTLLVRADADSASAGTAAPGVFFDGDELDAWWGGRSRWRRWR